MAEERQPNRRRFSWSYLFSFLLIVGIIVTVVVLILNRNTATTFTEQQFLNELGNNNITEITETPKGGDNVNLVGVYKYYSKTGSKPSNKKFYVNFSSYAFYENEQAWTYKSTSDDKLHYIVDNSEVTDPTAIDVTKSTTLYSFIVNKAAAAEVDENLTFTLKSADDPYVVSWWDQWGPTIIMLAGSVLIFIFLFFRLSSTVNGSNNKALEFNKSRA